MIELITLEQVLLSVLANGVGLCAALLLNSAPPRFVLHLCLASMLAILVPWASFGTGLEAYVPGAVTNVANFSNTTTLAQPTASFAPSVAVVIITLWFAIGVIWSASTIVRSIRTRQTWRHIALCDHSLAAYANPAFAKTLRRTRLHRLPNSSIVCATGLLHTEIWIGDHVRTSEQIRTALNHELCHIAANDHFILSYIAVVERFLWWNPLIWLLGRQARRQMEYACDSRCQLLLGTTQYRHTLAELLLERHTRRAVLEVSLGSESDIINRMEKIGMTYSLKLKHILALVAGSTIVAVASTSIAAQEPAEKPTLMQCHKLLPKGVQYDFKISSDIDTRDGKKGNMTVSLVDAAKPDSDEIPAGSGEFLRCVQKVVGVGDDKGWPDV